MLSLASSCRWYQVGIWGGEGRQLILCTDSKHQKETRKLEEMENTQSEVLFSWKLWNLP